MTFWIIQNTLVTGLLAVAVWSVCRWRKMSPAVRHALWLVVLVKFLLPPLLFWPWALPVSAETVEDAVAAVAANVQGIPEAIPLRPPGETPILDDLIVSSETFEVTVPDDGSEGEILWNVAAPAAVPNPMPAIEEKDVSTAGGWLRYWTPDRLARAALMIWAAGAVTLFLVQLLRIRRVVRQLKRAGPAPEWLVDAVRKFSATLGIRPPRVRAVPMITSPVLWALGRPTVLWPQQLAEREHASWRGVVVHELAHLRRRDHWVGWLELVAGCIWWWNPLFWVVRHQVRENAELACDAWVVEVLPDGRRSYAEALLAVCEFVSQPVPMPAVGIASGARRAFERRLTMILSERVPKSVSRTGLLVVLLLGLLALPGWSQGQNKDSAAPDENQVGEEAAIDSNNAAVEEPEIAAPAQTSDEGEEGDFVDDRLTIPQSKPIAKRAVGDDELAGEPAGNARDAKLRQLEQRMQALMRELRGLLPRNQPMPSGVPYFDVRDAATGLSLTAPAGIPAGQAKPKLTIGLYAGDRDSERFRADYSRNVRVGSVGLRDWLASSFVVSLGIRHASKNQDTLVAPWFLIEGTPKFNGYKDAASLVQTIQARLAPLGGFNLKARSWMSGTIVYLRDGVLETNTPGVPLPQYVDSVALEPEFNQQVQSNQQVQGAKRRQTPSHVVDSRTITLTRTTYRLNRKKGDALAAFLKAQLDVQVTLPDTPGPQGKPFEGDVNTITVVAPPETQQAIGQIIAVMQKSQPKPSRKVGISLQPAPRYGAGTTGGSLLPDSSPNQTFPSRGSGARERVDD